jgi:hypothetical protein
MKFLVLCTGNSARPILVEVIPGEWAAKSRSIRSDRRPVGRVHPTALALLQSLMRMAEVPLLRFLADPGWHPNLRPVRALRLCLPAPH